MSLWKVTDLIVIICGFQNLKRKLVNFWNFILSLSSRGKSWVYASKVKFFLRVYYSFLFPYIIVCWLKTWSTASTFFFLPWNQLDIDFPYKKRGSSKYIILCSSISKESLTYTLEGPAVKMGPLGPRGMDPSPAPIRFTRQYCHIINTCTPSNPVDTYSQCFLLLNT